LKIDYKTSKARRQTLEKLATRQTQCVGKHLKASLQYTQSA